MAEPPILLDLAGPIATLTLNRPAALNALEETMAAALAARLAAVEHDAAIRCLVVRGAGDHFMAGGDVKRFAALLAEVPAGERAATFGRLVEEVHTSIRALRRLPIPVVAAVRGAVAGFGVSLMLACDLAIAADDALFTVAYGQLGTSPDGGATFHLGRAVGQKRAMELALLGERIDAATAARYGLVNRVVPVADLKAETGRLAARLAAGATAALGRTKALLNQAFDHDLDAHLDAERDGFVASTGTADFAEGVAAFVARRPPRFTGR